MTRAASSSSRTSSAPAKASPGKRARGYFECSQRPLTSLMFLIPLLLIYEFGAGSKNITAFTWVNKFFQLIGVSGRHLPALAVVCILMGWHLSRRDSWVVEPKHLLGMLIECIALAFPLILIGKVTANYLALASFNWPVGHLLLAFVGAGIYEELVFRLIAFWLLSFLFINVLSIKRSWANLLMVVVSSIGFSLYHYLGYERFQMASFVIRSIAGFYFGLIFIFRGFGISAGCHTAYDVIVASLAH